MRKASTGAYRHVDALDVIAGSVGVDAEGKFGHDVEKETYAALADLIDRQTCKLKKTRDGWGMCSNCGAFVRLSRSVSDCTDWLFPRYCLNCGAEVVE